MIALWTRAEDFYRRTQILSDGMMFLFLLLFCLCCALSGVCCCCKRRNDDYDEDALAEWQRLKAARGQMSPSKGRNGSFFYGTPLRAVPSPSKRDQLGSSNIQSFFDGTFDELDPPNDEEEFATEKIQAIFRGSVVRKAKRMALEEEAEEERLREENLIVAEIITKKSSTTRDNIGSAASEALSGIGAFADGAGEWISSSIWTSASSNESV